MAEADRKVLVTLELSYLYAVHEILTFYKLLELAIKNIENIEIANALYKSFTRFILYDHKLIITVLIEEIDVFFFIKRT